MPPSFFDSIGQGFGSLMSIPGKITDTVSGGISTVETISELAIPALIIGAIYIVSQTVSSAPQIITAATPLAQSVAPLIARAAV